MLAGEDPSSCERRRGEGEDSLDPCRIRTFGGSTAVESVDPRGASDAPVDRNQASMNEEE